MKQYLQVLFSELFNARFFYMEKKFVDHGTKNKWTNYGHSLSVHPKTSFKFSQENVRRFNEIMERQRDEILSKIKK